MKDFFSQNSLDPGNQWLIIRRGITFLRRLAIRLRLGNFHVFAGDVHQVEILVAIGCRAPRAHVVPGEAEQGVVEGVKRIQGTAASLKNADQVTKEDLEGAQFVIKNPNAQTTCGCGSSFSA